MFERILTPRVLRLCPFAALTVLVMGFAYFIAVNSERRNQIAGDFSAFYAAGRIVREGSVRQLYEPGVQREHQGDLLPPGETGFIAFAYPPFVAAAFAPFTRVDYRTAFLAYTLLMVACSVLAVRLLSGPLPLVRAEFVTAMCATLSLYPMFRAVVGGQNTAISLLCIAGAAQRLARGDEFSAGLWIGAWTFKPQLALPVAVILALRRRAPGTFLLGVATCIGLYYVIGAAIAGPGWPVWWVKEGAVPFAINDLVVDRQNGVSFREFSSQLGVPMAGWIMTVVAAAFILRVALRRHGNVVAVTGAAAATAVLMAPHALYYDGGLAVLPLAAAADALGRRAAPLIVAAWVISWLQMLRDHLPVPPVMLVLVIAVVLASAAVEIDERSEPRRGEPSPATV